MRRNFLAIPQAVVYLSSGNKNIVCRIFLHLKTTHSSTAETGTRSYHVHRDTSWNNITIHQPVKVMKERNEEFLNINVYCCYIITISRLDKTEPVSVGHISRVVSRNVFYFCRKVDQQQNLLVISIIGFYPNYKVG